MNPYSNDIAFIHNGNGYNSSGCSVGNPCGKHECNKCRGEKPKGCTQIGTNCVFYGKDAGQPSLLRCLQIPNGASLTYILEAIDTAFCNTIKPDYSIFNYSCFSDYNIKTQQQFVEVVAGEMCKMKSNMIVLGDNLTTNDIVKVKFVKTQTQNQCGFVYTPRTTIDIELLLNTIKNNQYLKELFCSICPLPTPTPVPIPVYQPVPVYQPIPVPVFQPIPTPIPIVQPLPLPQPLPQPIPVPVNSCVTITNFGYQINGQSNVNGFNLLNGSQDVNVSIVGYQPAAYTTPVTYEFILDFDSTGITTNPSRTFPSVNVGNHTLSIIVYNCGTSVRKDLNFSITALPIPIAQPQPIPVPLRQVWNLRYCSNGNDAPFQLDDNGVTTGVVIKDVPTGSCLITTNRGNLTAPLITDYVITGGDCTACLPIPVAICQWVDDTFYCDGTTRMVNQRDGCGNTRNIVHELNSKHCGYYDGYLQVPIQAGAQFPVNTGFVNASCNLICGATLRLYTLSDISPYTLQKSWSYEHVSGPQLTGTGFSFTTVGNPLYQQHDVHFFANNNPSNCLSCSGVGRINCDITLNGVSHRRSIEFRWTNFN